MLRTNNQENSATISSLDRRREERISVEFPIEVSGFDCHGRFCTERTSTEDVGESSCSFHLKMEVEKEMVLAIRVISHADGHEIDPHPVLFYVARVESIGEERTVGVVKLAPRAPWKSQFAKAKAAREFVI
jgi:hypothetical protein